MDCHSIQKIHLFAVFPGMYGRDWDCPKTDYIGPLFVRGFFVVMHWMLFLLMGCNTVSENCLVFPALGRCLEHVNYSVK